MTSLSIFAFAIVFFVTLFVQEVHGWAFRLKCNLQLSTDTKMMKRHVRPSSSALHPVSVQIKRESQEDWSSTLDDNETNDSMIQVRLQFPDELRRVVEWVVEVSPPEAAEFVGKSTMCRGRRANSKKEDHVSLRIKDPAVPFTIIGAYAAGFEAVTLTDPIQIGRTGSGTIEEL